MRIIWSGVYATVWLVWWSAYTNYIIRSTLVVIITCFCFDCRSYSFIESATTNISRGVFGAISGKVSDDPPPCCISVFLLYYSVLLFLNYNSFSVVRFYFAELNVPQFCYFKTRFWNRLSYIGIQCNLLSGSAAFWGTCWLWWAYFYVISTDRKLSTSIGYDRLPNSKPQGQLRRFLLCYLQVCKYVLFPVWGIILFGILISAVLTRCQSSNATLLCWIFGFQFFASMFCFFFFVSWEGLLAKGCFLLRYLRLPCVCLEARFCSRNSQVSHQPLWLSV